MDEQQFLCKESIFRYVSSEKRISADGFHLSSGRAWPILVLMKADQ